MSKFLDDFRAALDRVFAPNPSKADVDTLKNKMAANDATDAEQTIAINELVAKLAISSPPA